MENEREKFISSFSEYIKDKKKSIENYNKIKQEIDKKNKEKNS